MGKSSNNRKNKKVFYIVLVLALMLASIFVLTACEKTSFDVYLYSEGDTIINEKIKITMDESYTFPVPTKKGYIFLGWYSGLKQISDANGKVAKWTHDKQDSQLVSRWQAIPSLIDFEFYLKNDEITVTKYIGTSQNVIIPSIVTHIEDRAFKSAEITNVEIMDGVKTIGISAFESSTVKSVVMANSVIEMEAFVFSKCENLQNVTLSEGLKTIPSHTFEGCVNLKEIIIPEGVIEMSGGAFYDCPALSKAQLPSTLEDFGGFNGCKLLENITIPAAVRIIRGAAFGGCSSLETVTFEEGSRLEELEWSIFYNCAKIKRLVIPQSVKKMGDSVFRGCMGLEYLSIPFVGTDINGGVDASGRSTEFLGYMFGAWDNSLFEEFVPASLKTVEITGEYFISLNSLDYYRKSLVIGENVVGIQFETFAVASASVIYIRNAAIAENIETYFSEGRVAAGDYVYVKSGLAVGRYLTEDEGVFAKSPNAVVFEGVTYDEYIRYNWLL